MLERHGLPRPTVNHMVQLPDGGVVFMDIAFVGARVDVEYDGKHHEQQWEADAQRRLRIESAGWDYVQVVNCSMRSEEGQRMVAEVVARHIEDRTGINYLRTTPFTLEQLADRRRSLWKTAP
ncbi:GTPase, translation factor [Bifidobacterium pseudolongum subsp. globosum]|nr:GTPase, translation factor [Bifidobacterium pseudolongum subsp. globosum]